MSDRETVAAAPAATSLRSGAEHALSGHGQVARVLGTEILAGRYPPGGNLPGEAELLGRFGVSRTVLREVLKTLAAKGMVSSKTRIGTRVSDPASWNLFDATVLSWRVSLGLDEAFRDELLEIRRLIEPRAAELAALRGRPDDVRELRRLVRRMGAAGHTARSFAEADLDFHLGVGSASGNTLMRSLAGVIEAALVASFTLSSPTEDPQLEAESVRNHERIVDAIERGDAGAASAAMRHVIEVGAARVADTDDASARDRPRAAKGPNDADEQA